MEFMASKISSADISSDEFLKHGDDGGRSENQDSPKACIVTSTRVPVDIDSTIGKSIPR